MKKTFFKISFGITFVAVEYLALTPQSFTIIESFWDKQNHLMAFMVLSLLVSLGYNHFTLIQKFGLLMAMGLQIEVTQYFIPGRFFSLGDWCADGIGIMIGLAIYKRMRNDQRDTTSI
jgi:VanZ family protein